MVETELVVRGMGEVTAEPDFASVRVGVDGEGQSQEQAYLIASTAAAAVDEVFADNKTAIERVTTAAVSVEPKTRYRKGEYERTGWEASRVSLVHVKDTSRVGELLHALTGAGARLRGLSWIIEPKNEAFARARQRAGEDARARAQQYALGLGVSLGPVVWASEPGLRSTGGAHDAMSEHGAVFSALPAREADEPISVTAEELTVSAAVEVGFRLLQKDSVSSG